MLAILSLPPDDQSAVRVAMIDASPRLLPPRPYTGGAVCTLRDSPLPKQGEKRASRLSGSFQRHPRPVPELDSEMVQMADDEFVGRRLGQVDRQLDVQSALKVPHLMNC